MYFKDLSLDLSCSILLSANCQSVLLVPRSVSLLTTFLSTNPEGIHRSSLQTWPETFCQSATSGFLNSTRKRHSSSYSAQSPRRSQLISNCQLTALAYRLQPRSNIPWPPRGVTGPLHRGGCTGILHGKTRKSSLIAGPLHRLWRWGGHGVRGPSPEQFQKLKPIASISGHLVPFQCNYNERLFDSATSQEDATIGDNNSSLSFPGKKFQKLKAIESIFRHLVPSQCN